MQAKKQLKESGTKSNWAEMDENILQKIFMALNVVDLVMRVCGVCRHWRKVAQKPCLWGAIDMKKIIDDASLERNNHKFLGRDGVQNLKSILACSAGNVTSLICLTFMEVDVPSWIFIADRTPMLESLVLTLPESLSLSGFCEAVKRWPALKSLTVAGVDQSKCLAKAISENCPEFSELKLMGFVDYTLANSLITFLPKLKVLSLRGSLVQKVALNLILEKLEYLEILNISHCLYLDPPSLDGLRIFSPDHRELCFDRAPKLRSFMVCRKFSCPRCMHAMRHYTGLSSGWFDHDGGFWKEDELSCFNG